MTLKFNTALNSVQKVIKILLSSSTHWAFLAQSAQSLGNFLLTLLVLRLGSVDTLGFFTAYYRWVLVSKEFFSHVALAPMSIGLTRQQVPLSVPYIWFVFLNCAVIVGILAVFCAGVVSVAGVEIDYRLMLLTVAAAVSLAITEIGRRLCLLQGYGLTALSCEVLRWALSLGISCVLVTEHIFGVVLSALFAFFFAN